MKVIFHLDLDSYFVSAQRTIQPELIGKPVAITSGERRSIISAASYEAKSKGVYIPMPFYKAQDLVPNLIAVKPDYALYTLLSTKLFEFLSSKITNKIEVASIDECYMDVTDIWSRYGSPAKLAKHIQTIVMQELKLPISIGIANNKFVAKMSTQVNKPMGITSTKPGDFIKNFGSWPTIKIHGVGGPTAELLRKNGINTIEELSKLTKKESVDILGVRGVSLLDNVNERGDDEIDSSMNDLKGIGNSITFMDKDRYIRAEILEILQHLCNTVSIRLNNRNMAGRVVSVMIKEKGGLDAKAHRKQLTLDRPISSKEEIFSEATRLFDDIWDEGIIKFIGVHVTKLTDVFNNTYQQSLFDEKVEKSKIDDLLHSVNAKLGHKTVASLKEVSENLKKKQNQSRFLEADRIAKKYEK